MTVWIRQICVVRLSGLRRVRTVLYYLTFIYFIICLILVIDTMCDLCVTNPGNFQPLEVVDRSSETQLQVADN